MGGGNGMEVDLTHGAVAAMSRLAEGLRPVLQVVGAPRLAGAAGAATERCRVMLSDGVHSQEGILATSLNGLVTAGLLRDGSVVRVLDYVCNSVHDRRVIILIQLEMLQTECTLIGSPTIYEVNAAQPNIGSYSGGLGIHGSCMISRAGQVVNNIPCAPDQGLLGPSIAPRAQYAVNNLPFGGSYGSLLTRNAMDSKMQQLSMNTHQGQMLAVPSTDEGFGRPGNTYCHSAQQPPPVCMNRGPVANNDAAPRVIPIAALSPYQGRWTIKGRVTAKTDLRRFGEGKVFSFDLLDAQGGEIRATCFNSVVDQFYDQIVVGNVYFISKGSVKPAQKKFNPLNSEYEIVLDASTSIEICCGDDSSIPKQQFNFRQISEVANMDNEAMVDLLGVVTSVSPSVTITRKNSIETQKRTLQLKDMSGQSVEITLWGNYCDAEGQQLQSQCDSGLNPVLALKGGRVCEFNGKSVGTTSSSQLKVNPDFPEAERLRQWYITEGKTYFWKTIAQIKDGNFGRSDQPDFITVKATISHINMDVFCYQACILMFNGRPCNKKVTANGDGMWWCDRCQQCCETCWYRYLLTCQIQDHTGITYATAFEEAGEDIIGLTAQELFTIKNLEHDDAKFEEIMQGILWRQYVLKLRIKKEIFNDQTLVKCSIVKAEKLDASDMNRHVLGEVDGLLKKNLYSAPQAQGIVGPRVGFTNLESAQNVQSCNNGYGMTISGLRYELPMLWQMSDYYTTSNTKRSA